MPTWRDMRETDNLRALTDQRQTTGRAVQSQYSASPRILALAHGFQKRLDPESDANTLFASIVNLFTASGWGLDNWGRILGISRTINNPKAGNTGQPVSLVLDDEPYRLLLLYKAMANISAADAASLNALLASLVRTGIAAFPARAYVIEVDVMVIRWVLEDFLNDVQLAVFLAAGTLARGAGVGWQLYAVNPGEVLGFDGSEMQPFNQAPFVPDDVVIHFS